MLFTAMTLLCLLDKHMCAHIPALKVYSTGVEEAGIRLCMLLTPDRAAMKHLKSVESYLQNRNVSADRKHIRLLFHPRLQSVRV